MDRPEPVITNIKATPREPARFRARHHAKNDGRFYKAGGLNDLTGAQRAELPRMICKKNIAQSAKASDELR